MKSQKLGAILTTASTPEEMAQCAEFTKSASSVYVLTHLPVPNVFGLFAVRIRNGSPSLWEALVNHIGRIRGKETIGIVLPGVVLPTDFSALQHSLGSNRMELSWAFRANASWGVTEPDLIVITTSLMPHIVQNLKQDVPFERRAWSAWLHNWCLKTMPSHKYLDVTDALGLPDLQPVINPLPTIDAVGLDSLDNGTCRPHPLEYASSKQKAVKRKRRASAKKSKKS